MGTRGECQIRAEMEELEGGMAGKDKDNCGEGPTLRRVDAREQLDREATAEEGDVSWKYSMGTIPM